jgi:hypothetical protein
LGTSERRTFTSTLEQLQLHLLELEFHPAQEARNHWCREVNGLRRTVQKVRRDSPSLWARRAVLAEESWRDAVETLSDEFRIDRLDEAARLMAKRLPPGRPNAGHHDLDDQVLRPDWYPEYAGQ